MSTKREATLQRLAAARLGAIIRTKDRQLASDAMGAAVRGGFRFIEFTMNTPGALELIAEFARDESLLVGAGTVMTTQQVRDAVAAGATFIVSPHTDAEIIAETRRLDAVSVPGTTTPSEMVTAQKLGADIVKLFPAPANIATYVRQIVGPLPELRIFPTAGVGIENFKDILNAGAFGVGFVSSLFDPEDMKTKNFEAIERRAIAIHQILANT